MKLISKIVGATLGLALAIGVSVGATNNRVAKELDATVGFDTRYTLNTSSCGNTTNNSYNGTGTKSVTNNGHTVEWTFAGNGQQAPWRVGGKGGSKASSTQTVDRRTYTTSALDANVDRIEITLGAITNGNNSSLVVNSMSVSVHNNSSDAQSGSNAVASFTPDYTSSSAIVITNPSSSWNGKYYSFNFNITLTGSANSFFTFSKVEFLEIAAPKVLSSIELSGTYPTSFVQNDEFSHEGLIVTAIYDDASSENVTNLATFSGYDMSTAGNQTVAVSYTENAVTKTATYGISVKALAPINDNIVLDYSELTATGDLIAAGDALSLVGCSNSHFKSVGVTRIYNGNGTGGAYENTAGLLKTGTSSIAAQIVFSLDGLVNRVSILCHDWFKKTDGNPTNSNTVSVNGSDELLAPYNETGSFENIVFKLDEPSKTVTIDIANRIFIKEIRITYIVPGNYLENATAVSTISGNETGSGVENVSIRLGVSIPKADLDVIASKCIISEYGVMMFKRKSVGSAYSSTNKPVEDAFNDTLTLTVISRKSSVLPTPVDDAYTFSAQINYGNANNYGNEICAASFIVVDGVHYFLCEKQESAKSLAQYYLDNTNTTGLSDDALQAIVNA